LVSRCIEVVRIALILPLLIVGLAARLVDHEVALALASVHVVGLLLAPLMLATFLVTIAVFFLDALAAVVTPRTLAALLKLFLKLSFILLVVELAVIRLLIRVFNFH
jgi:hypothetical protein